MTVYESIDGDDEAKMGKGVEGTYVSLWELIRDFSLFEALAYIGDPLTTRLIPLALDVEALGSNSGRPNIENFLTTTNLFWSFSISTFRKIKQV